MIAEVFTSRHWTDLISNDLHAPFSLLSSFTPSSPLPLLFSFCSLQHYPRTVRRYRQDQITMATISHIVIAHTLVWWLFLFWGAGGCCPYLTGGVPSNLFWWRRNNVAICWIQVFAHSGPGWTTASAPVMTHHSQSHGNENAAFWFLKFEHMHVNRGSSLERSGHHRASSSEGSRNGKNNTEKYICIDLCTHSHKRI